MCPPTEPCSPVTIAALSYFIDYDTGDRANKLTDCFVWLLLNTFTAIIN